MPCCILAQCWVASLQVQGHVLALGNIYQRPTIGWTPAQGSASRLVLAAAMGLECRHQLFMVDPLTGKHTRLGSSIDQIQKPAWRCDPGGSLAVVLQPPPSILDWQTSYWEIKCIETGEVLFKYQQDCCPHMPYPAWARPSNDIVCCLVRKLSGGKEAPQAFLRFHQMQQIQAGVLKWGDAHNTIPALHEPSTNTMTPLPEHHAKWVKECQVKLPAGFAMTAVCPEGCIIISLVGSCEQMLVHFDTNAGRLLEIMQAGQPDKDLPEICLDWVPAGQHNPARFIYVAALANRQVVLVDAHQHVVLWCLDAAGLLQGDVPQMMPSAAWLAHQCKQPGRAKAGKQVQFLSSTSGIFARAASGGLMSIAYF